LDRHRAWEASVHRIETQEMGVGLDRAEIVDADDFDILAAGLGDGPQDVAADAAKPVDCDADCHLLSPLKDTSSRKRRVRRPPRGFCCGRPVLPGGSGQYSPLVVLFAAKLNRCARRRQYAFPAGLTRLSAGTSSRKRSSKEILKVNQRTFLSRAGSTQ